MMGICWMFRIVFCSRTVLQPFPLSSSVSHSLASKAAVISNCTFFVSTTFFPIYLSTLHPGASLLKHSVFLLLLLDFTLQFNNLLFSFLSPLLNGWRIEEKKRKENLKIFDLIPFISSQQILRSRISITASNFCLSRVLI